MQTFQQLLECVNDDQVTYYASANRDLQPSEGDPSPLLTPDPLPDSSSEPLPLPPPTPSPTPTPTCAPTTEVVTALLTTNTQVLTIFFMFRRSKNKEQTFQSVESLFKHNLSTIGTVCTTTGTNRSNCWSFPRC